ncbi:MAG: hypothetical protein GT589_08060 [Peptoclostridium sp.]|nr:hypothetical protein [Peptoclostridium sp.]
MKKQCFACNVNISKDEIGLNQKLIGRNIEKYFCLECLSDYLEVTTDELVDKVQEFKEQGCMLFI